MASFPSVMGMSGVLIALVPPLVLLELHGDGAVHRLAAGQAAEIVGDAVGQGDRVPLHLEDVHSVVVVLVGVSIGALQLPGVGLVHLILRGHRVQIHPAGHADPAAFFDLDPDQEGLIQQVAGPLHLVDIAVKAGRGLVGLLELIALGPGLLGPRGRNTPPSSRRPGPAGRCPRSGRRRRRPGLPPGSPRPASLLPASAGRAGRRRAPACRHPSQRAGRAGRRIRPARRTGTAPPPGSKSFVSKYSSFETVFIIKLFLILPRSSPGVKGNRVDCCSRQSCQAMADSGAPSHTGVLPPFPAGGAVPPPFSPF